MGGVTTKLIDVLDSSDGGEWDTVNTTVNIPAGANELTLQAFSRDDGGSGELPASFTWNAGALTLNPPSQPEIDIEKYVQPETSGDNVCESFQDKEKPAVLSMPYTGAGEVISNPQEGKASVDRDPGSTSPVFIVASDKENLSDTRTKIWFQGSVILNSAFDIDAGFAGERKLKADTYVQVFTDSSLGTRLQLVKFHTSCSKPLNIGDEFGSVTVQQVSGDKGTSLP